MKRGLFIGLLLLTFATPSFAFADSRLPNSNVWNPSILAGPLVTCTATGSPEITRADGTVIPAFPACKNLCDLVLQIENVIYFVIAVVIWIITPMMFLTGGILLMLGGTNPGMIAKAKATLTGALWGLLITISAWLVVYSFVSNIGALNQYVGGFPNGKALCTIQPGSVGGNVNGLGSGF